MSEQTVKIEMLKAQPLPLGAYATHLGIRFAVDVTNSAEKTVLSICRKNTDEVICEIVMNDYPACGSICAVLVRGLRADWIYYRYTRGKEAVEDIYGMKLYGSRRFGVFKTLEERAVYEPFRACFSWEGDVNPAIPYNELVMYKLHVRGFTRHGSSGISHKGTFLGIGEKLPYLKELGVNALVLMPVADFPEMRAKTLPATSLPVTVLPMMESGRRQDISMLSSMAGYGEPELYMNCWGYGEAQFFAPKAAYASKDARAEFCQMVRLLHDNGIEVILELLFPDTMAPGVIIDCLRHWVMNYHVDGFLFNREVVPAEMAATDPVLSGIKLICSGFDTGKIYGKKIPARICLGSMGDSFQNTMRCFLKGDGHCLEAFIRESLSSDPCQAPVHYITSQNGFTLADLVAYNDKHNEDNGEDNKDGANDNHSWNCGAEGKTRSRKVLRLRRRQMYNAMLMLLFSQGTPMLYSGDEFGNSQKGNNNAYCHDNDVFWLNWRDLKKNRALFDFVKAAIALRQSHPVLHPGKPYRQTDYLSCGFPDLSLHGHHPWKVSFGEENRYIGMMYCGKYARVGGHEDQSFYFAYNMHWEPARVSLPVLPKGQVWKKLVDTWYEMPFAWDGECEDTLDDGEIAPRSIQIFMSAEAVHVKNIHR